MSFWSDLLRAFGKRTRPAPVPVGPSAETVAGWEHTCRAVMVEHRQRPITEPELVACVAVARAGGQVEQLRAWADALPADPVPEVPALERVRADGRFFVTDSGTFRPVFASALTLLTKTPEQRAVVLDEIKALGFTGVRVFAGALTWAGQTPQSALDALPAVLDDCAKRGLYAYVCALTDTGTGYNPEAHLAAVAGICAASPACFAVECVNELGHPTQSGQVNDPDYVRRLGRSLPAGLLWTVGSAIGTDELDTNGRYPTMGGLFNDAHLDRGRDKWNQVRRLREIAGISDATKQPAMSGEPIGAAEVSIPGKREADPAFWFAMGALARGFEIGAIFHSSAGLAAEPLGPVQRACAEAFIAGGRAIDTDARLSFQNATWGSSPVAGADFSHVVRVYSFVSGNAGFAVLVGLTGDPALRWANGWTDRGVVTARTGIQIRRIGR